MSSAINPATNEAISMPGESQGIAGWLKNCLILLKISGFILCELIDLKSIIIQQRDYVSSNIVREEYKTVVGSHIHP